MGQEWAEQHMWKPEIERHSRHLESGRARGLGQLARFGGEWTGGGRDLAEPKSLDFWVS